MRKVSQLMSVALGVAMFSTALFTSTPSGAQSIEELSQKAVKAATVLQEISTAPDRSIPTSLLSKAVCIATVPDVIKAGFIFGGRFGRGLASCRTATGWSNPSFLTVVGGSWGFQIGIASMDTVLVFMNSNAVQRLSVNNFTLGGDVTVAAGPVGRDLQAGTDYQLNSEIYSYSRAKGIFGGLALTGTAVAIDKKSNGKVYTREISALDLLTSTGQGAPNAVIPYVSALNQFAP